MRIGGLTLRKGARPAGSGPGAVSVDQLAWWLLAATIALLCAILFWMVVTPVSPLGDWRPTEARTVPAAARASLFGSLNPFNRGAANAAAQPQGEVITALPLTLFGTRMNRGSGAGSAIIAGADGIQKVYRTGSEVMPGVRLYAVGFDFVTLDREGVMEKLFLDQSKPADLAAAAPAKGAQVSGIPGQGAALAGTSVNADALRDSISFKPVSEGGKVAGLSVSAQGNDAPLRQMGLIPGDLITTINGQPVTGTGDAMSMLGQAQSGQSLTFEVKRGGETVPITVNVK